MSVDQLLRAIGSRLWPLLLMPLVGCGGGRVAAPPAAETVCVDIRRGDVVVVQAAATFPAVNPTTGERTLMPGLYCPACRTWHVAPPIEQLHRQRGVARCPKSGTPLVVDGPHPTTSQVTP